MSALPFPPPPEPGWYDDDETVLSSANAGVATDGGLFDEAGFNDDAHTADASADAADGVAEAAGSAASAGAAAAAGTPVATRGIADSKEDVQDWDGTVLSSDFMMESPTKRYTLHNEATGQSVTIACSTLLGRRPSATVPQGAVSVKLDDPTRTVSRNHAALSFDRNGVLWIEDYGSLNGTYVIRDNVETRVEEGVPLELKAPAVLRMGDQFIEFNEAE